MPEFIAQYVPFGLSDFIAGYLECAEFTFTDCDDSGNECDPPRKIRGWSAAAVRKATRDCEKFQRENATALARYYELYDGSRHPEFSSERCAGHDFWYTRNGHGVGFADRGTAPEFEELDQAAGKWSECDMYRGDSAWLHFSGE